MENSGKGQFSYLLEGIINTTAVLRTEPQRRRYEPIVLTCKERKTHTLLFAGTRKLQLSLLLVRKLCSLGMSKAVHCSPSRVAHTDSGGLPPDTSTIPKRLRVIARGRQESMNRGASFRRQLNPRSVDLPITNDDSCAGGNRKRRRF